MLRLLDISKDKIIYLIDIYNKKEDFKMGNSRLKNEKFFVKKYI